MMRHVTIGALIGFGLTVLALVLWGGGSGHAPPPPPPVPPSPADALERPIRAHDPNALHQAAMREPNRLVPLRRRTDGLPMLDRGTPPVEVVADAGSP